MAEKDLKFGERLHDAIIKSGLLKKTVAQRAGITPSALSGYINSGRIPEAPILHAISQILKTTMEELLTGKSPGTVIVVGEGQKEYKVRPPEEEKNEVSERSLRLFLSLGRILSEGDSKRIGMIESLLELLESQLNKKEPL